jgi:hypothetical protein
MDRTLTDLLKYWKNRNQRFKGSVLQNIVFPASARMGVNKLHQRLKRENEEI